jgi:hypothetical protein
MILTNLYLAGAKNTNSWRFRRGICSVLSSSRSDGSIVYIKFVQDTGQLHGLSARFRGMTHSESPLLHAILEESPSEDDMTSSEGESFGSPLLRVCSTVIPIRAHTPTLPPEGTLASQAAAARPQRTTTSTTFPEQQVAHQDG